MCNKLVRNTRTRMRSSMVAVLAVVTGTEAVGKEGETTWRLTARGADGEADELADA
jgi:hypothetical protein